MASKKTVLEIKQELKNLGVPFKSSQRKAELVALLAEHDSVDASHYSPPYTRRKTLNMATVDVERIKSDVMTLDGSPLNHASAILSELENSHSEEVSVDVRITEESSIKRVQTPAEVEEGDSSEQTVTTTESEDEEDSDFEIIKEDEVKLSNGDTITTTKTTRRRSERIQKHSECAAALFSDDDELPIVDVDGETDSQPESESSTKERWSLLLKIFLLSILFAIIANAIAYIHLSNPEYIQGVLKSLNTYLPNMTPAETPVPPVE